MPELGAANETSRSSAQTLGLFETADGQRLSEPKVTMTLNPPAVVKVAPEMVRGLAASPFGRPAKSTTVAVAVPAEASIPAAARAVNKILRIKSPTFDAAMFATRPRYLFLAESL